MTMTDEQSADRPESLGQRQAAMHRDYFDRAKAAVEEGFYLEAVFLEYAAIEGRLEVLLGILGAPCNRKLDGSMRSQVKISHRIDCLRYCRRNNQTLFEAAKLPDSFFADKGELKQWIRNRNVFVHGLYKNADEYQSRRENAEKLSIDGLEYSRLLYNEAKRLNRLLKNHPEQFDGLHRKCRNSSCVAAEGKTKENREVPT